MNLKISPTTKLSGSVQLPGDKSISHRSAIFAALAEGDSRIENFLVGGVTQVMLDALEQLGVSWELQGTMLSVHSRGMYGFKSPEKPIYCGNSATTMRLLAGLLAAVGVDATLDGSEGLRRRPMGRIMDPLLEMGVPVEGQNGCAPITIHRPHYPLKAIHTQLPVASAQVKSCLLLSALAANGPTSIVEPGLSRDHTERMLRGHGIEVRSEKMGSNGDTCYSTTLVPPRNISFKPLQLCLPGDFSSAAFLIVATLITPNSLICIHDVGLNPTRTGLLDALLEMGADIHIQNQRNSYGEPIGDLCVKSSELHGCTIHGEQVVRMIDEFPIFSVAAAYAKGTTLVKDAAELRLKESDRIASICNELTKLGVGIVETTDGYCIHGGTGLVGTEVDSHGDHRLAMSLAVAGLGAQSPLVVKNAEMIDESYPQFISTLARLGAEYAFEQKEERLTV